MLFGDCVGVDGTSAVPAPATCVQLTDPAITARIVAGRSAGYCPSWVLVDGELDQLEARNLIGSTGSPDPDQSVCPLCVSQRADDDNVPGYNKNKQDAAQDAVLGDRTDPAGPNSWQWGCIIDDTRSETHVHYTSIFDETARRATDDGPLTPGTRGWTP